MNSPSGGRPPKTAPIRVSQLERKGSMQRGIAATSSSGPSHLVTILPARGDLGKAPPQFTSSSGQALANRSRAGGCQSCHGPSRRPDPPEEGRYGASVALFFDLVVLSSPMQTGWRRALQTFTATVPPALRCAGLQSLVHVHSIKQGVGPPTTARCRAPQIGWGIRNQTSTKRALE